MIGGAMWSNVEHAQESAKWLMLVLVWLLLASWRRLAVCVGPFICSQNYGGYMWIWSFFSCMFDTSVSDSFSTSGQYDGICGITPEYSTPFA
jgi:hypothetical protein